MKAETLAALLREQAERYRQRGNLMPVGEDQIPYAITEAFSDLADALDLVEDES